MTVSQDQRQREARKRLTVVLLGGVAGVAVGIAAVYGIGHLARNVGGDPACAPAVETARKIAPLVKGEVAALTVAGASKRLRASKKAARVVASSSSPSSSHSSSSTSSSGRAPAKSGAAQATIASVGKAKLSHKEARELAELVKKMEALDKEQAVIADLLEKQIAALAIDGLRADEIKGIQDTAIAFGLAKDERIKGLLIEGAAATAFAKLEEDHALDYIKDGEMKAIAHAAFVDSIGKDITMGLIPNYDKALAAAKAANGVISETASIYNGLNS